MIRSLAIAACGAGVSLFGVADAAPAADPLYELRTYHAEPGKLDALLSRFRDHTCRLFEKHGMTSIGYWVPEENAERRLIYLLSYPDRAGRETSWKNFLADEEWRRVSAASETDGKLVGKIDQTFLHTTDFSPGFPPQEDGGPAHRFELRTYVATPGNLPALHRRFRDHTIGLFKRHGMTNGAYFRLAPDQPAADDTLVYFLLHRDAEAAGKSWAAFRADPEWITAKEASEAAAGGSLTVADGVSSLVLKPVDFSPLQ